MTYDTRGRASDAADNSQQQSQQQQVEASTDQEEM